MYTSAVPELSSENTTPTPQNRKKRDKSPFYSRDNMKRSEDLGVLVAVCTQSNKRAALTAQLASASCTAGSYLLQTSKASFVSCPQDAAQHQVAPVTGSLPSQAFATQACTIPRADSGQCCAGTGPRSILPFPQGICPASWEASAFLHCSRWL